MPRPTLASAKSIRTRVGLPGVLGDVVRQRWNQFRYPAFSPFALESSRVDEAGWIMRSMTR